MWAAIIHPSSNADDAEDESQGVLWTILTYPTLSAGHGLVRRHLVAHICDEIKVRSKILRQIALDYWAMLKVQIVNLLLFDWPTHIHENSPYNCQLIYASIDVIWSRWDRYQSGRSPKVVALFLLQTLVAIWYDFFNYMMQSKWNQIIQSSTIIIII